MAAPTARVLVVADDLIWSTRLAGFVRAAGAEPVVVLTEWALDAGIVSTDLAIVDLTARDYDPLACVVRAAADGRRVLCVGQHDDHETRKAALAAGASRVLAYRKLAEDGATVVAAWIGGGKQT
ncbi:MAG TPA: hypothetical protein VF802_01255 [Candidatus Limnocylindrales bacterium]